MPADAKAEWDALSAVGDAVRAAAPNLGLTVDAVESRGFEYHTGITFSIFAKGIQREIGRGGRYRLQHSEDRFEHATGATLVVDNLLSAVPAAKELKRLWVPSDTPRATVRKWQADGWTLVAGLKAGETAANEARRLDCTHYLERGEAVQVRN